MIVQLALLMINMGILEVEQTYINHQSSVMLMDHVKKL